MSSIKPRKGLIFLASTMSLCAFSAHFAFTDRFNTQQRMHDGLLREMKRIKEDRFGEKKGQKLDIDP